MKKYIILLKIAIILSLSPTARAENIREIATPNPPCASLIEGKCYTSLNEVGVCNSLPLIMHPHQEVFNESGTKVELSSPNLNPGDVIEIRCKPNFYLGRYEYDNNKEQYNKFAHERGLFNTYYAQCLREPIVSNGILKGYAMRLHKYVYDNGSHEVSNDYSCMKSCDAGFLNQMENVISVTDMKDGSPIVGTISPDQVLRIGCAQNYGIRQTGQNYFTAHCRLDGRIEYGKGVPYGSGNCKDGCYSDEIFLDRNTTYKCESKFQRCNMSDIPQYSSPPQNVQIVPFINRKQFIPTENGDVNIREIASVPHQARVKFECTKGFVTREASAYCFSGTWIHNLNQIPPCN